MEKIKLIVADDNREFCRLVKAYAEMIDEVEFCGAAFDGISALELIGERQPDVVLLDNIMPLLDGIGVMKHLQNFDRRVRPKVVAFSASVTQTFVSEMNRLGADYVISRNMDVDEIIGRCIMVVKGSQITKIPQYTETEGMVTATICAMGMPANLNGYSFVRSAIEMTIEKPEIIHFITKELYPQVAKLHKTTSSRVERNIRNAIEAVWTKGNRQEIEKIFGTTIDFSKPRPSNSVFIATVADRIRLTMKKNVK